MGTLKMPKDRRKTPGMVSDERECEHMHAHTQLGVLWVGGTLWAREVWEKQKCSSLPWVRGMLFFLHSVSLHLFVIECLLCARPVLNSEDTVVSKMGMTHFLSLQLRVWRGERRQRDSHAEGNVVTGDALCSMGALRGASHPRSWFEVDGAGAPCPHPGVRR